jgi:hypothetical protein
MLISPVLNLIALQASLKMHPAVRSFHLIRSAISTSSPGAALQTPAQVKKQAMGVMRRKTESPSRAP